MTLILTVENAGTTEVTKVANFRVTRNLFIYEKQGRLVEIPLEHVIDISAEDLTLDQVANQLLQ